MFLLDTNVVSELGKPAPDSRVLRWLAGVPTPHPSVITVGELIAALTFCPVAGERLNLKRATPYTFHSRQSGFWP